MTLSKFTGLSASACTAHLSDPSPSPTPAHHLPMLHTWAPWWDVLSITWIGWRTLSYSSLCHPHALLPSKAQCKYMKHKEKPNSLVENLGKRKKENKRHGAIYLHCSLLVLPWSPYDFPPGSALQGVFLAVVLSSSSTSALRT